MLTAAPHLDDLCSGAFRRADFTVAPLHKRLLVDPHERARVVGLALVLDAVEAVPPLAVVPLVVVVVLHLPHGFKHAQLCELERKHVRR